MALCRYDIAHAGITDTGAWTIASLGGFGFFLSDNPTHVTRPITTPAAST
jgi:hypothetical protein